MVAEELESQKQALIITTEASRAVAEYFLLVECHYLILNPPHTHWESAYLVLTCFCSF